MRSFGRTENPRRGIRISSEELEVGEALDTIGLKQEYQAIVLQVYSQVQPVLDFLPRTIPDFTDHGRRHSNNLLKLFLAFKENLPPDFSFSQEELLLLGLAIYLHDIGCIIQRENHNRKSAKLIMEHKSFCSLQDRIGADLLRCLRFIILAHSSNYDLQNVPKEPLHKNVRLRLISAVFRLLDSCEISAAHVSKTLFDILTTYSKIKPANMPYWQAHLSISSLVFKEREVIVDSDVLKKTQMLTDHLKKELKEINKIFREEHIPELTLKIVRLKYNASIPSIPYHETHA